MLGKEEAEQAPSTGVEPTYVDPGEAFSKAFAPDLAAGEEAYAAIAGGGDDEPDED